MYIPFRILCYVLLMGLAKRAFAEEGHSSVRPAGDLGPTICEVFMGLLDVDEVDSANQSFTANFYMEVSWQDMRLVHEGPESAVRSLNEIWHPRLIFVNQQRIVLTIPDAVDIAPDGWVTYRQRVWGPFSQPLEIQDFPFDEQRFELRIASSTFDTNDVVFVSSGRRPPRLASTFSLPDWKILDWHMDFGSFRPSELETGTATFAMVVRARRYASTYVIKVIIPLILIVIMSAIVFWIDPKQSGTQIGVATTSMLTLIAYRFMVGNELPPVPYLTRMDLFILGSTGLVFVALLQAVGTAVLVQHHREQLANRLDIWCRWIFPVLFIVMLFTTLGLPPP